MTDSSELQNLKQQLASTNCVPGSQTKDTYNLLSFSHQCKSAVSVAELKGLQKQIVHHLFFYFWVSQNKWTKKPQNLNLIFNQLWIALHINKLLVLNPVHVDGQDSLGCTGFLPISLKPAEIPCSDDSAGRWPGDTAGNVKQVWGGSLCHSFLLSK